MLHLACLLLGVRDAWKWRCVEDVCMCMMDERAAKRDEIHALAKGHTAERLWVFGAYVHREDGAA